jgi:hypothetical protein
VELIPLGPSEPCDASRVCRVVVVDLCAPFGHSPTVQPNGPTQRSNPTVQPNGEPRESFLLLAAYDIVPPLESEPVLSRTVMRYLGFLETGWTTEDTSDGLAAVAADSSDNNVDK